MPGLTSLTSEKKLKKGHAFASLFSSAIGHQAVLQMLATGDKDARFVWLTVSKRLVIICSLTIKESL